MSKHTERALRIQSLRRELRDARCCDALEPCESCQGKALELRSLHRAARADATPPRVPAPRRPGALVRRLFRA